MSFSDTRLGGSDSCSTTQFSEGDTSESTSRMSVEVSSEDAPCIEAEGSSSATAIRSSSSSASLTSQVSGQSSQTSPQMSSEHEVSTTDFDNGLAVITDIDRPPSHFSNVYRNVSESFQETLNTHELCTHTESLLTSQPNSVSVLGCSSKESALIDSPVSVNTAQCQGQTLDNHDAVKALDQVDSCSDTSKRARDIIEKDFGAETFPHDVQSGTSSDSLSTCCMSDPALFIRSNIRAQDKVAEQNRSKVSDPPVSPAHVITYFSFPARGDSGTNVDLLEEPFETPNERLKKIAGNAIENEVKDVQCDCLATEGDEENSESNKTPPHLERINSRVLLRSSSELATVVGNDPQNRSSDVELEGRKISFSKMMDSAQSFRPMADCMNEAMYSGQTSIRTQPFGIQSAFGNQRLAVGTVFSSSEFNAQPNSVEEQSNFDGSFHQIREAQLQARDSLLAAIHLANRLPLPAEQTQESNISPRVRFNENVVVGTFSGISPTEELITTESQLLASPVISQLSDRYGFKLSDEQLSQESELSNKSGEEEEEDELANTGSDQQGCFSQHSVSNWLQSYLFDTDNDHSRPYLMRKSSSDVLKDLEMSESTSLGVIAHRLQQMLKITACGKSMDSGVPVHETETDFSSQPSLANISALLEQLLQRDGGNVSADFGSSQELDTNRSTTSLETVGLLFDELMKSLPAPGLDRTTSSDEQLLSSGVNRDSYAQYAVDTCHAFQRYALQQKSSFCERTGESCAESTSDSETTSENSNIGLVGDLRSEALKPEQKKASICKEEVNSAGDLLQGDECNLPMIGADESCIGPTLSNIADFLTQALSHKQHGEVSEIFLQKPASNLDSAESEMLATIGNMLQRILRCDRNEQTTFNPSDTVFVLDMNSGSARVYKSPEDKKKSVVGNLFERIISQTSSAESSRDTLIHQKMSDAFLMFKKYLSRNCPEASKKFVEQDYSSSQSSEEDRHDVENFVHIANNDQNCDQHVLLENGEPSLDVKKQFVIGTTSAPIDPQYDGLKVPIGFEKTFHSGKQDLDGLGTHSSTCSGQSTKLSSKKNASEKDLKSTVKKGSSQSLPGTSSIKIEMKEKSDSAETVGVKAETAVQRDPVHSRTTSVSSGASTLSTKDSLPGDASPLYILKTKQLQKVQAMVSHSVPGMLKNECDCTAKIDNRPCCKTADRSVVCTHETIRSATGNQAVTGPEVEHSKPETREEFVQLTPKEESSDNGSQEQQIDRESEIKSVVPVHQSLSEESSFSDVSHASSIVDIVLRNLSEKLSSSNASISSDTVSACIKTQMVSEVQEENVRTDLSLTKEITSGMPSCASDVCREKNVKQSLIEGLESSKGEILADGMTSLSLVQNTVADQSQVNDSSVLSRFVESNETLSSKDGVTTTCIDKSQANAAKCASLPARQAAGPSAAVPHSYPIVDVRQKEIMHDTPSCHSTSSSVIATSEDGVELSSTVSNISSFSYVLDNPAGIDNESRCETLSQSSGLSFLGHLATSEVLRREYESGSIYEESSDTIGAEANNRKDTFSQVQSDQTEYTLNDKYRLQTEKHHYSSSAPQVGSAISPSVSSDMQWGLRGSDYQEGDGQSSEGDETEDDGLDGWVDMVGGHGDDEVPELDLMGDDDRFLFNVPVAAQTDPSSSSSSEGSGYTPPIRDVRQNHDIADDQLTSDTTEMKDDDNGEAIEYPGTAFSQNVSHTSVLQQSTSEHHEDSRGQSPVESLSQTMDEHVLETMQPARRHSVVTPNNTEVSPDMINTSSSIMSQASGDGLNMEAGSALQGNRSDELPDGRSSESCFIEKALNSVRDSEAAVDDQVAVSEAINRLGVNNHDNMHQMTVENSGMANMDNVIDKETHEREKSVERIPAEEARLNISDPIVSLVQGTSEYLCKRNQSVQPDVTREALAELKNVCPDLRLDPIGCSSGNESSFRMIRNPCYGPSSESLEEEIVLCCDDSFVNSYQNGLPNQLECISPSTSQPIRPARSSKSRKVNKEKTDNTSCSEVIQAHMDPDSPSMENQHKVVSVQVEETSYNEVIQAQSDQLPSCSKDSRRMENLHQVASALVVDALQRSIAEIDSSSDTCKDAGKDSSKNSSQCNRSVKTDVSKVETSNDEPSGDKNSLPELVSTGFVPLRKIFLTESESMIPADLAELEQNVDSTADEGTVSLPGTCRTSPHCHGMDDEASQDGMVNVKHSTNHMSGIEVKNKGFVSSGENSVGVLSGEAEIPNSSVFIIRGGTQMEERSTQTTEAWEQEIRARSVQVLLQHRSTQTTDDTHEPPERSTKVWLQHVAEPAHRNVFQGSPMIPCVLNSEALKLTSDQQATPGDVLKKSAEIKHIKSPRLQTSTAESTSFISRCFDARPHSQHVPLPTQRSVKMKAYPNVKNLTARANLGSPLSGLPTQRPESTVEFRESEYIAVASSEFIQPQSISYQMQRSTANCPTDVASQDTPSSIQSTLYSSAASTVWQGSLSSEGAIVAHPVMRPFSCDGTAGLLLQTTQTHSEQEQRLNQTMLQVDSGGRSQPSLCPTFVQDFAGLPSDSIGTRPRFDNGSSTRSTASQTIYTARPSAPEDLSQKQVRKEELDHGVDRTSMMGSLQADFGGGVYVCDRTSTSKEMLDFSSSPLLKVKVITPTKNDPTSASSNTEGSMEATELCITVSSPVDSVSSPMDSVKPTGSEETSVNSLVCSPNTQAANLTEGRMESPQKGRVVPILSSNYKIASQDVRTFLVEKVLLESRCRKLELEVSILQSDKKRLEERSSQCLEKNSDLESKLAEVTQELEVTKINLSKDNTKTTARKLAAMEKELEALKLNNGKLSSENESLKTELSSMKKLSESQRHTHVTREITATLDAYKAESAALKAELAEVKDLLNQSEAQVQSLEEQKRSAETNLVRLTEVKEFLNKSGGNGLGETAAEYMTKILENRLKLNEERFFKERENMGKCLTKVEEKLLTQNSKLVTSEMELTRQLTLAKDRCRHLDEKTKELRELNLELRLALPLGSDILNSTRKSSYDLPDSIHSTIRAESKLMTTDVKEIMTLIQRETGLCPGQETDMVCELWRRYEAAGHKLQEWQQYLFDLKISEGDITTGLQNLKEMKNQYDEKIRMAEEEVEEILNEKNTLESTYKKQVSELVKERHEAQAKMKTVEDLMAAMKAENDTLKEDMLTREAALNETISGYKAQLYELSSEKDELEVKVSQLTRSNKLQKVEIDRLEAELAAKERTLADVTEELEYTKLQLSEEEKTLQRQIDSLSEQTRNLEADVEVWQDKYQALCEEKVSIEEKVTAANQEVVKSKAKSAEEDEKKTSLLEHALEDREIEVRTLTKHFQESEAELEQTKQQLLLETERNADITKQLESLQQELQEKRKFAESQNMSEKEQLKQLTSLKEALEGVTQELHKSKATLEDTQNEVKKVQVDLSLEKDKTSRLEEHLAKVQQQKQQESEALQRSPEKVVPDMSPMYHSTPASTDLRNWDLEQERDRLKGELSELTLERETASQLTADKSDLEQHLQCCLEEKDELYMQKEKCDRDLEKLEQYLHDIITKFDLEARQQHGNFQRSYAHLGPEAQKHEEECLDLRVLLEGKDAELGVLSDKLERQKQDMDFCRQKINMLLKENQCHRNDISNQTVQLALKMKEMAAMMEVNQLLVSERSQLQMELHQAQTQLDREVEQHDRRNQEVAQILNKFDAESQKSTQHEVHKLENKIIALEADSRHANNTISQLGTENQQNKAKMEQLNEDVRSLTNMNSTLEQRLEAEKHTVSENQATISELREEMKELTQKMDFLKHEKTLLMTSVESERKTAENLKTQLESKENELKQLRLDLDTHRGQLLVSRENYEQLSKEKQNIYADYQELCRQLNEKEKSLVENQAIFNSSMENIQRDFSLEKASLETDKSATMKEMDALRDEIRELKEKVSQKEVQLCTFGRTLQELEEMTKQNQELEEKLQKMVTTTEDSKILINSHRTENMTLRENLKDLEEKYAKLEAAHRNLEEEFRAKRDNFSEQTLEFKHNIAEMKTAHEMEKFELKEKVARLESQLETAEANLKTLQGSHKDSVTNSHSLESTLQQAQAELHRAETEKQIASQKLATIEEEYKKMKRKSEEFEVRARQARAAEAEKYNKLKKEFTDLQAAAYVHESNVKAKQDQVDMLQEELNKLRQVLETQRQQLASRLKRASFDFKQQTDNLDLERKRLSGQLDQVMADLEQAREQVSVKGRENRKLQEDLFNMEAQVREVSSKLRQTQDSLRHEEDLQQKAKDRNIELEEELKKVKSFVSKKVQDDGTGEVKMTWNDMNRFMQELNLKMDHLNAQKIPNNDNKDSSTVHRLRKQLAELQTELHTEKALHQITRSSLQASEDDCQRLRRQLRSKQRTSSVDEKSQKSRMEKINEIIAKSQTQAQMMMASGGYHDYSSRDVSLLTPRSGGYSPDTSLADQSALFNTSYNNNTASTESVHVASSAPEHK
ncbi:uncharacterized protein LOC135473186 [Liolophura sinensis]|uniref:uncharacterized protein LOC135473186 n=1 Tax=Liolophura sinensis TaxID=3198878 RepID=UPI00315861C3